MNFILSSSFSYLQKIGKALMLPVAVLPAAGILMAVGTADFAWMSSFVSQLLSTSGNAIFLNLPLLFAVSVAISFTKNDGVAALSTCVAYLVMLAAMGRFALWLDIETVNLLGFNTIDTGVLGGIVIGCVVSVLFNRFYNIRLPDFLGFFSGKRFVPIVSSLGAIAVAFILTLVWPPLGSVIKQFSHWAAHENSFLAFSIYGTVERLLIPFGLHHIWNVPFFFEVGSFEDPITHKIVHGEIARYLSGDPTSGNMAGGYLFKMFGLPAAALAIWHSAKPEKRKWVGGIMLSAGLTAFFTGITEPIEFAFLFVAPFLYFIHSILSGCAYGLCILLGVKHSMTFSHGLIDYLLLLPHSSHAWAIPVLGLIYGFLYYFLFRFFIAILKLPTLGNEITEVDNDNFSVNRLDENLSDINLQMLVKGLGGANNILNVDSCVTRLRIEVDNDRLMDKTELNRLGASGVFQLGSSVQLVFGARSEILKTQLSRFLNESNQGDSNVVSDQKNTSQKIDLPAFEANFYDFFGGKDNIISLDKVAHTRLRLKLDKPILPKAELKTRGIEFFVFVDEKTVHCFLTEALWG